MSDKQQDRLEKQIRLNRKVASSRYRKDTLKAIRGENSRGLYEKKTK